MDIFKLEGKTRVAVGKVASKADRTNDTVPCNLYGGNGNTNFSVDYNTLKKTVFTDKFNVIELNIDGKATKAIVKEIQFHALTDKMMHVDFQELIPGAKVKTEIPLFLKGFAKGQQAGGKLEMKVRKLKVKADVDKIPSRIELDVTNLEMGKSLRVKDIQMDGIEILTSPSLPVATVSIPRALRGAQPGADAGKK